MRRALFYMSLVAVVAVAMLVGVLRLYWMQAPLVDRLSTGILAPSAFATIYRERPVPVEVPRAVAVASWSAGPRVAVETMRPPTPREAARWERRWDLRLADVAERLRDTGQPSDTTPTDRVHLLAQFDIPRLPRGGEAIVTADASGRVTSRIIAAPRRFFGRGELREAGIGGAIGRDGRTLRSWVRMDAFRVGPLMFGGEGWVATPATATDIVAAARQRADYGAMVYAVARW